MNFGDFFKTATGGSTPYDYRCRLACGDRKEDESKTAWLGHGTSCDSKLIKISTGLGKTAAVVLAWLWNRTRLKDPNWLRRLGYCLPVRTLVEQTSGEVKKWIAAISAVAKLVAICLSVQGGSRNSFGIVSKGRLFASALRQSYETSQARPPTCH